MTEYNENFIVIEGMTSVSSLIKAIETGKPGRPIYRVLMSDEAARHRRGEINFLRGRASSLGFRFDIADKSEFDALVSGQTHGGIAALCGERVFSPVGEKDIPNGGFFVMLEGIEDPYNFGYTLRSLYAAGADGVILPVRNWMSAAPTVIKSSAGASELLDIYAGDLPAAAGAFRSKGYKIIAAGIRNSVSFEKADLRRPLLLIIGGEKRGISRSLLECSDLTVRIDYGRPFMGSLTTAASAAVFAFEVLRRSPPSDPARDMPGILPDSSENPHMPAQNMPGE